MGSEGESSGSKKVRNFSKDDSPWGRLVSSSLKLPDIEIQEDEVTFDVPHKGSGRHVTQSRYKIYRNVNSGIVKLQNLSSCGILINGQYLAKDEHVVLEDGNEIILGPERKGNQTYHFHFLCGDQHGILSEKVSSIVDNMKCSICLNVWHDVVSVTPCLHNFCNACFSLWYRRSGKNGSKCICPECRSDIYSVGRNHSLRDIVECLMQDVLKYNSSLQRSAEEISRLNKNAIVQSDSMIIGKACPRRTAITESSGSDEESLNNLIREQCPQCVRNQGSARSARSGFHCTRETAHVICQACWGLMPLRTDISVPQMCAGCEKVLCGAYWASQNDINPRGHFNISCNNDALLPISRRTFSEVPRQTHNGNAVEQDVTKAFIEGKGKTVSDIVQEWNVKLDAREIDQPRLPANPMEPITSSTHLCNACAKVVVAHILHHFRLSIPKHELPPNASRRDDCWWGHVCRTQRHNMHHALKLNHVCEPTRRF